MTNDEQEIPQEPSGPLRTYAVWPPRATFNVLGYVRDLSNRQYSRDVGRTSSVGGRIFWQFGDTFCKNDAGQYVGLVAHTVADHLDESEPSVTAYAEFDARECAKLFIPFTKEEARLDADPGNPIGRPTLWSFGGIVEDFENAGTGWSWFELGRVNQDGESKALGTGIVRVRLDPNTGLISATRPMERLFEADEPRWGTFSTLAPGDGYFYLWGHRGADVLLARVRTDRTLDRSAYQVWNGSGYGGIITDAKPVMKNFAQGQFYRSSLFEPGQGRDFIFVGCDMSGSSSVLMATAPCLEGPWEEFIPLFSAPNLDGPDGYRYCMYPHPWAFKEADGELLVTWSEHWPGGVIAAKVKFEMGQKYWYHKYTLPEMDEDLREELMQSPVTQEIARKTGTTITPRTVPGGQPGTDGPRPRSTSIVAVGPTAGQAERAVQLMQAAVEVWLGLNVPSTRVRPSEDEAAGAAEAAEEGGPAGRRRWASRLLTRVKETSKKIMKGGNS
ncbi:MAG: hypothetical protein M1823_004808 [Watsoniomyces obsoletus]|nr:MAG: hypothetical protein M1823_004808 [Watsoniomyces obsoletus]